MLYFRESARCERAKSSNHEERIMSEENENIGENAGKVWQYLSEKGSQSSASISKGTGLRNGQVDRAIGWLAREGKVNNEQDGRTPTYALK
jgi:predicted transcriptional regulator